MGKNANFVSHKKSKLKENGGPKLPLADDLVEGEIAINFGKDVETLSIKNESGDVVTFSSDNYYTEKKLGSGFTGENSANTVTSVVGSGFTSSSITDVIIENERIVSAALTDLDERKLDASAYTPSVELWVSGTGVNSAVLKGGNNGASGTCSVAEGAGSKAIGDYSHAEGHGTATGDTSHAEGIGRALGSTSHAEGNNTTASGSSSHAEGSYTIASGQSSHAEGNGTTASGSSSHAEGTNTKANGDYSHTEGYGTIANNQSEHASGQFNVSSSASTTFGNSGNTLFSVGNGSLTTRHNAFEIRQNGDIYITSGGTDILLQDYLGGNIEIDQVIDSGTSASTDAVSTSAVYGFVTSYTPSITVDQDFSNTASTNPISTKAVYSAVTDNELVWTNAFVALSGTVSAHTANTEIHVTAADKARWDSSSDSLWESGSGVSSVVLKGSSGTASGDYSVAEGYLYEEDGDTYTSIASGTYSHTEGGGTQANGNGSHAEGIGTQASGQSSHAEGSWTQASGNHSHSEGAGSSASGNYSHAEGFGTVASGESSHAEGYNATASGQSSHAEGYGTKASGNDSHAEGSYTTASGQSSHAEGNGTTASGNKSHAEGTGTKAFGDYGSHAEGNGTTARGESAHAEGDGTEANGEAAHAEGYSTEANGKAAHAEGSGTQANNMFEHASGYFNVSSSASTTFGNGGNTLFSVGNGTNFRTRHNAFEIRQNGDIYISSGGTTSSPMIKLQDNLGADLSNYYTKTEVDARDLWESGTGLNSVAQKGGNCTANGICSVAEGSGTTANGNYSHAEGGLVDMGGGMTLPAPIANGDYSHVEGIGTVTSISGASSHAEGNSTQANGASSHAEGANTQANGNGSHAEGAITQANGDISHAEGMSTIANGDNSHSEGSNTQADGAASHAEGESTNAIGQTSHAEGKFTTASGGYSHAEGYNTETNGSYSHSEGYMTAAFGEASHAEGYSSSANGDRSHAEGHSTTANNQSEHASGQYNVSSSASTTFGDSGNTLFSVGNGTANNERHNAFEIRQNGDIYITSGNSDIKLQDYIGGGGGSSETITAITPSNSGSTAPIATKVVAENELTVSNALNDLNTNKADKTSDLDGLKLKKITQAAYDALVTKDPNTLYVIVN